MERERDEVKNIKERQNQDFVMQQIKLKNASPQKGPFKMTDDEYKLNRQLLKELNEQKKTLKG
jgi:hypothetical protein